MPAGYAGTRSEAGAFVPPPAGLARSPGTGQASGTPVFNGASRKLSQYDQTAFADYRPTPAVGRLAENIGATEVELTPDDLREIDRASSRITVQGARLSEDRMKLIDR